MKSKRAEKYLDRKSPVKTVGDSKFYYPINRLEAEKAVELAEQDAEEEVNHYRKELEESKRREELARNVIDDQRKKIEALKARAAEAYCKQCGWYEADGNCSLNEDKCPKGCEYANQFIREVNDL